MGDENQTAMLELYQFNVEKYGAMLAVDVVVANIWMAFILLWYLSAVCSGHACHAFAHARILKGCVQALAKSHESMNSY